MYHHMHPMHRCARRGASRFVWFFIGAGTATWWHYHKEHSNWYNARHCGRDRIPQNAYPAPGSLPPPPVQQGQGQENAPPPAVGPVDKWDRWGWGQWGRSSWPSQENTNMHGGWDKWGWNKNGNTRPEGAWGPPTPLPASTEKAPEKDVMQQATDTIAELSEATLNNLLVTVESLKTKLAEHRAQRDQQDRELQALREARFRQFEEWQRQQEQLLKDEKKKDDSGRRLV